MVTLLEHQFVDTLQYQLVAKEVCQDIILLSYGPVGELFDYLNCVGCRTLLQLFW